jgi:DNA-binding MarR family transcriptional regulator
MSEPRWLDDREARAWRGYEHMRGQLSARLEHNLLRDAGLSGADYAVLVNLSEAPGGRMRAFELGRAMHWEKSRLSHQVTRMARRGLVRREVCPSDARGSFVALTDEGLAVIEAAAPGHVEDVRRYFIDLLTPAQLDVIADATAAVLARLAEEDTADDACAS